MHEKMKVKSLSGFQLFVTKWTVAYQASPSMGFSRQEYWSGLPLPSPGDLPDPGIALRSPALRADALPSEPPGKPQYPYYTAAKSLQSCPTLCDPIVGSPPGSPVPGILQARTLEWVAISFSNVWKWKWSRSVVSDSQRPHGLQPTRLLHLWDFPGKSTGVGCHCLLWIHLLYRHIILFKLISGFHWKV